jgi:hypothetical protein
MEKVDFPEEIRALVDEFDTARKTKTLLRARFRAGKSGAFVGLVDCQGHHDGVFVLKVDSKIRGEREQQNHLRALELGAFQSKIPAIVDSFEVGDSHALLLKIAGGSRIAWRPLVESLRLFASGYGAAVRALWSPGHFSFGTQEHGMTLVPDTLGRRLDPSQGRILHHARAFLATDIAVTRAFHHLGEILPNPLHFALNSHEYKPPAFRPLLGPCHGDCHAANLIVVAGHDGTVRDIALIDLAQFRESGPFYYDTSYLELATLLRQMDSLGQERWRDLTTVLAQGDTSSLSRLGQFERAWASDMFSGRVIVQELVEREYGDRKDDLTLQGLLCQVSVGLAFIHKKPRQQSGSLGMSPEQYLQAFIWAAFHLRRFLEVANIAWIPAAYQVLPIGLQRIAKIDTLQDQWRDLIHFDQFGFNILILSPLARSANDAIVDEVLKSQWNLIIDLGTGSLSGGHSSVRQGIVRQAWPMGSPPDLSVLVRGALWYFANGRTDVGEAPPASGAREWRQRYLVPFQGLLGAIAQRVAPPSVRCLVIGDDFSQDLFRVVLESVDSYLGAASQPALVATTNLEPLADVPMSCVALEEVVQALRSEQGPAAVDFADGVLLPHRTERGIRLAKVAPEFVTRIQRDLEIIHRGLADWFPPIRAFGTDFRRGQLIEWSELDNNLDVERPALSSLLHKIRTELAKSTNSTVNLLHEPSAGGTTLSRRVAWSLMEEYPVVLLSQMSRNTPEYLAELFQRCGLPVLIVMEAEVVTESERELLFQELMESNTRAVFLWVSRIYGNTSNADILSAELDDKEAESFRVAYEQEASAARMEALDRLTFDPALREQRNPFFYGLVAFEDTYLGLDRLVSEIVRPLDPVGKELVGDLAIVSFYCSEGFPAAEFDELCKVLHHRDRPFPAISPFTVTIGPHIKNPHHLISVKTLRLLARVPDHWDADLGRFALTLLQHLKQLKLRESDRLKDMVTSVFVTRDTTALLTADTDILAGGLPRQGRFAPLIRDLGSAEIARKVLHRVFNDWPSDPHFAVHYARHLLYEEPREIEQAMRVAEMSRRTELGRDDDTVVHTLGMCYRIRMESTLKAAREKQQSLAVVEASLESDSKSALECFAMAGALDRISEYGHLSSIQTVSTLLRGATELSGTDLAGLLRAPRQRWLASALERAEESITLLQSRPGPRLSVRARRTIAEWALVYGQVDKVIQELRVLSEGQQDPGVRRALCSALLTKYKRKWITVPDGELQTIAGLMERNIESNDFSDSDLSRWLRASRLRRGFDIERAIERLIDWHKLRPEAVEPAFYLYVFYFLRWLNSGRSNEGYIGAVQKWLGICRENRPLGSKQWSYEWLVERGGWFNAVHFTDLEFDPVQTMIGRTPEHRGRLTQLGRLEGTLSRYVGPQHALVDLGQRFTVHITPRSEIVRDHEGRRLRVVISFSYDGPIGWNPEVI